MPGAFLSLIDFSSTHSCQRKKVVCGVSAGWASCTPPRAKTVTAKGYHPAAPQGQCKST